MKLSSLIALLTEIYNQEGDMNVAITRNGNVYRKIDCYVDNDCLANYKPFIWLEAYKSDEEFKGECGI